MFNPTLIYYNYVAGASWPRSLMSMSDDGFGQESGEINNNQPLPLTANGQQNEGGLFLRMENPFELLRDERRRIVLARLRERKGKCIPLEWLAEEVASAQPVIGSPSPLSDEETRRTAVSLHHTLLPKLDDAGVLTYDTDERICRYFGSDTLEALLDTIGQDETW